MFAAARDRGVKLLGLGGPACYHLNKYSIFDGAHLLMRWHMVSALAALVMAAVWHGPARAAPLCVSGLTTPPIVATGAAGYACDLGLARYTFNDTITEWKTTTIHFAEPRSTAMGLYTPQGQTTAILAPNEVHRVTFQGFTNPDGSSFLGPGQDYGIFGFEVASNKYNY
jgi:hypothetical protein